MAVLFRNLSGQDRAILISQLRDRGILPNQHLKSIVTAQDRDEFKNAVQSATRNLDKETVEEFFNALQDLIRSESIDHFISEDVDTDEFLESYF